MIIPKVIFLLHVNDIAIWNQSLEIKTGSWNSRSVLIKWPQVN